MTVLSQCFKTLETFPLCLFQIFVSEIFEDLDIHSFFSKSSFLDYFNTLGVRVLKNIECFSNVFFSILGLSRFAAVSFVMFRKYIAEVVEEEAFLFAKVFAKAFVFEEAIELNKVL